MANITTWQIDPTHSSVEFSTKHMMITTVRGRFKEMQGAIHLNEADRLNSWVEVEFDPASVDTGVADRDAHLRGPEFFDAENYPKITFRSKRIENASTHPNEGDRFQVIGDLMIRDTTEEVTLDVTFEGRGKDPWGNDRAGLSATTEIDRREWGLRWNQAIETGGVLVANKVRIEAQVQVVKQAKEQEATA